jgi:hypothetical protein
MDWSDWGQWVVMVGKMVTYGKLLCWLGMAVNLLFMSVYTGWIFEGQ